MIAEATATNTDRQLPWRMRADLHIAPLTSEGRPVWGIKDPVSLDYFELGDEEHFVLTQLDGSRTIAQVCRLFHERFRPRLISTEELQGFVVQLISQGLVISQNQGSARILTNRARAAQAQQRRSRWLNLLAIRFRGFDPDRLFASMLQRLGWIFSPVTVAACLILILSAVALVVVHFQQLIQRLPDVQAFLSSQNLVWLVLLLAVVKVLHEFGHGLTCKRFGGECHELGLMLLVFTPTLYCNVSDIWMVKSKWKRMAVGLAGIWVEVLIAAACTWLWWFSAPGLFHSLCLNLMFLCGVNTLIFNGNPLLRYDGYFVLADCLEVPNLRQQAIETVQTKLTDWFGHFETLRPDRPWTRDWGLFAFGISSAVYRVLLSFLILWGLYRWLSPYGIGPFVQCLAAMTIGSMIYVPLERTIRFLNVAENRTRIRWVRVVGAAALLVAIVTFPLPCRVNAAAMIDDDGAQRVYVTMAGTLIEAVKPGESVDTGQILARLDEPAITMKIVQLEGDLSLQRARLEQLERRRVDEPQVAQNIPTVREIVRDLEQQLAQLRQDSERLSLRAPCPGIVLPGPLQESLVSGNSLPQWSGSPLDEQNRGSLLREGTVVCLVGRPDCQTALLLVSQDDINLVRVGQRVRFVWHELAGEVLQGEIVELAGLDLDKLPRSVYGRLNLPVRFTPTRGLLPVGIWYQARVKLAAANPALLRNSTGQAQVLVDWQSLLHRVSRWLKQTFPL